VEVRDRRGAVDVEDVVAAAECDVERLDAEVIDAGDGGVDRDGYAVGTWSAKSTPPTALFTSSDS